MVTQFLVGRFVHLRTADHDFVEGQGLVEYALLLMLIALACLGAVTGLGNAMIERFWTVIQEVLIPAMGG